MGDLKFHYKGLSSWEIPLGLYENIARNKNKGLVCVYTKSYFCSYILPVVLYGTNYSRGDYKLDRQLWSKSNNKINYVYYTKLKQLIFDSSLDLSTIDNYYNLLNDSNSQFINLCNNIIKFCLKGFFYNKDGILVKFFK